MQTLLPTYMEVDIVSASLTIVLLILLILGHQSLQVELPPEPGAQLPQLINSILDKHQK